MLEMMPPRRLLGNPFEIAESSGRRAGKTN
jgi:hypothetical protein